LTSHHNRNTDFTRNELLIVVILAVCILSGIGALAYCTIDGNRRDAEINAQTEIAKSEIVEAEKTKRAIEHTKWLPWN